jgi:hypothetical protein
MNNEKSANAPEFVSGSTTWKNSLKLRTLDIAE